MQLFVFLCILECLLKNKLYLKLKYYFFEMLKIYIKCSFVYMKRMIIFNIRYRDEFQNFVKINNFRNFEYILVIYVKFKQYFFFVNNSLKFLYLQVVLI